MFIRNPVEFYKARSKQFGGTCIIAGLEGPEVMLEASVSNMKLITSCVDLGWPAHFKKLVGEASLPMVNGKEHQRQKALAKRGLTQEVIDSFLPIIQKFTMEHMTRWTAFEEVQPMRYHIKLMAFTIAQELVLGGQKPEDEVDYIMGLFHSVIHDGFQSLLPIDFPGFPFRKCMNDRRKLGQIYQETIDAKRASPTSPPTCSLDHILAGGDADGKPPSDKELQDFVFAMIFAGHDTVLGFMQSALHYLAVEPEVHAELRKELDASWDGSSPITRDLMLGMSKCRAFLAEVLRHDSPVVSVLRKLSKDTVVDGYHLPAGMKLVYPISLGYRSKYPDESINLKNWLDDKGKYVDKVYDFGSFLAFGTGSRMCIGYKFAEEVALVFLMCCIRNFELFVDEHTLQPFPIRCWKVSAQFQARKVGSQTAAAPSTPQGSHQKEGCVTF